MANVDDYLIPAGEVAPEDAPRGTVADFGKTLAAGAADIGAQAAASARYFYEAGKSEHGAELAKSFQTIFGDTADTIRDTMNPETRKLAAATLTSEEFWAHPVLGTALKTTGMVPAVAAVAIPGGLLADVTAATMFAAGAGGVLNAADGINQFYEKLDKMSDAELQKESPKYKAMREMMDEGPARARFNREAQGWGPALNVIIGAASGAVGPAGTAARALAGAGKAGANAVVGAGEAGAIRSGLTAAAEGAATNAVQEGVLDLSVQNAELNADLRKELDIARAANAALEGGALGGLMGGVVGAVAGGHKAPSTVDKTNKALDKIEQVTPPVTTTDVPGPQTHNGTATAPPAKPVESAEVGNPQNAPTRSERDMGKEDRKTAAPKTPVEPVPQPVDPAIAQAVAANEGTTVTAQPTEVAAMTQRSPNATLDILDQEKPAAEVPPQVTADTGMNVPEQPQTLAEQIKQIGTGDRKAVMVPKGTVVPADVLGGRKDLKRLKLGRGTFIYDPKLVTPADITKLSKLGRENELLGLGPVSKPAAVADAAAGATPVAVTERTPAGVEVKAAAGTDATVPQQVASLEAQKTPGNVVAVEAPENVLQMRQAGTPPRTGRILPNLTQTAETVPLSDFNRNKVVEAKEPEGKRYSEKERAARDEKLAKAKAITDKHVPDERETNYLRDPEARNAVIRRAQTMIHEADQTGVKVQAQLKKSTKGDSASDNPSMQILRAAKDLTKVAAKRQAGREITEATGRFAEAERLIRGGYSDEVLSQRRAEGDAAMRRTAQAGDVSAATVDTPESQLAAKENVEVASKEDVVAEAAAGKADAIDKSGNEVKTAVASSAKGDIRGVGDGTEVTSEGTVRAKAASGDKLAGDAERKAKLIAEMNAKLAAPKIKNDVLPINLNPTEAQKVAGNYKKGHRRVEGLDFTIENPKGAIRRGRDGDAEWQVRMPADYGYLRRTVGADGDHVDAYDGRSGNRFFVVDQLDHRTGEFDEHKVMMRFKDEAAAVEAYKKAFSDGKGEARLGYIHEVTPAELKEWLNKGDTTDAHAKHVVGDLDAVNFDVPEGKRRNEITAGNGVIVRPTRSSTAAAELDSFTPQAATTVGGVLAKFFQSRLRRLAGETDVHYLSKDEMTHLWENSNSYNPEITPGGLHVTNEITGHSELYLLDNLESNKPGWYGSREHILLHELAHAATTREIRNVPNARNTIEKIMRIARQWGDDNAVEVSLDYGSKLNYAFSNADEFIAETFANQHFQQFLSRIPIDAEMARYMGIDRGGPMSAWDVVRKFVQKAIEKITGKLPDSPTALDAILKVGEHLTAIHEVDHPSPYALDRVRSPQKLVNVEAFNLTEDAANQVRKWLGRPENNTGESAPKVLKLRTFDNIAQIADHYFGESNPVRKIHEAVERIRVSGERIFQRSEPIIRKLAALRASNKEQFAEFSSLLHDATVANVHPDVPLSDVRNEHLGKNRIVGNAVWAKAQHAELAKRYNALPEEFKQAWHETVKHFTDQQNAMSLSIIENQVLKLLGVDDAALAKRIHEGNLTDADRTLLDKNLDIIEEAGELSKIDGPYVPLMRRGDHVVKGDYKVTSPGNAKKISENEFEFNTSKEAEAYAKASPLQTTIKKIWVDPKTGERSSANELDSVDRYRVSVQNRHVEFVQGRRAAEARAAELARDGSIDVHKVVPRAFEPNARQGAELSTALSRLVAKLEHSPAYEAASPTQRAALRQAINEAALASHGSTRISSKALPRRGVQGYSEDLVQNTADYGQSSSRYLAKLEHASDLEAGLKEMDEQIKRDHSKTGQYARTAISNEVRQRVEGDNGFQQGGALAPVVKRALSASFTDKLGSPAYSVINAMQVGMVTMPYLAARHGVGRTFAALGKAYADIGAGGIVKQGAAGTLKAIKGKEVGNDFMGSITKNLNENERRMIDEHVSVGTIDPSAGMEISRINPDRSGIGGKTDAVLGYLEGVTREMPRAIESINRAVSAIAAYRMEIARGASHDAAVQFSKDAVNNTQFNYSPTNAPALFNHPLLKIALQFKKYGQGMYQMIGTQIGNAIRNEKPGDRATALKTLIGIAATHTAMAGALGLPTEPFKYLVMATAGITGTTWSDVENQIRKKAAGVFGKTGGEVFSRGLPRLLNIDLARMGLDSVTSFGEPKSGKDTDVKTWLFDSLSGPVVSLGGDYVKGLNNIANGNFEKAAEQMIPLKAASDVLRAYRQSTEGKKSASGKQTSAPYSPTEAGLRALGLGSGREAEEGAANSAFYRQSAAQKEKRTALVNEWVSAKPTDKVKAWSAIQKWNRDQPAEVKIAPAELTAKAKSDAKKAETSTRGITPNKRDKRFLDEGAIYNTR